MDFKEIKKFYKKKIRKTFAVLLLLFFILSFLIYFYLRGNSEVSSKIVCFITNSMEFTFGYSENANIFILVIKNIFVSLITILLGLIPFIFLPMIAVLLYSIPIGVIMSLARNGKEALKLIVYTIVPHGVIEIPALILSASLGVYLSLFISRKILKKEDDSIKDLFLNIIKVFVFVIIPMFIFSSIIQKFITPIIMQEFLFTSL